MDKQILQRRFEMITLRSKGIAMNDVVREIAKKYERTESAIWGDWTRKGKWINILTNLDTASVEALQGLREVTRSAWFMYTTAVNESVRIAALKLAKDCYVEFIDLAQSTGHLTKTAEQYKHEWILRWENVADTNSAV